MKKIIKFFKSFYFWPTVTFILMIAILLIGLFFGVRWLVSAAYADSIDYGYCRIEDKNIWQKINVAKEITDVRNKV